MIETPRLILRRWREEDRTPFVDLHQDPDVAYWLGGPRFLAKVGEAIDRYNADIDSRGFSEFAVERRADGAMIGAVGVTEIHPNVPVQGFEISWRLAKHAWGKGYAAEAARAAAADAFAHGLEEILGLTSEPNLRSQAVMARIGMGRDAARDFDHPSLDPNHPLRRHQVWSLRR